MTGGLAKGRGTRDEAAAVRPATRLEATLGAPVWWGCHLGVGYWLVPRLCTWGVSWPLHLLTVVVVALIVRAGVVAVRVTRAGQRGDDHAAHRDTLIGRLGLAITVLFGAVTLAEWVPSLFLDPCW